MIFLLGFLSLYEIRNFSTSLSNNANHPKKAVFFWGKGKLLMDLGLGKTESTPTASEKLNSS